MGNCRLATEGPLTFGMYARIAAAKWMDRLEKKYTGAQNKAPYLYRFRNRF